MIYGWSPGIGDPSFLGWFTVFAYFLTALLCFFASRIDVLAMRFWGGLGVALALLGLNKQLDLQSLLTAVARELAYSEGWYDRRREFQELFVFVIAVLALAGSLAAAIKFKNKSPHVRAAAAGFTILGAFICIRAASFHHVDRFLNSGVLGARFNWIIELAGIFLIALNALGARNSPPRNHNSRRNLQ